MREHRLRAWIIALLLLWAPALSAQQKPTDTSPVLITADQVTYDRDLGVVVASGHVEVSQNDRVLTADTLTYNERRKTVAASGNVALLDPDGNVAFADYMEVSDDLKNAVIQNIRLLLADKSRMAAAQGTRKGDIDVLDKGVYSPCLPCTQDPLRPPIWQLTARKIVHDNKAHEIEFHDVRMEIYGVPVLYSPYFSHPDPTVKRKSGFLTPSFGGSGNLGGRVIQPYFWAIAPDRDLTVAPIITTKANPVITGTYRQRLEDGSLNISGGATYDNLSKIGGTDTPGSHDQFQGYIFSTNRFDLNDNWRAGLNVNRTTDRALLQIFNLPHTYDPALNSEAYAEGFDGRSYATIQAWTFQGLGAGIVTSQQPIVAPLVDYEMVGEPGKYGGYWSGTFNAMALTTPQGADSRRLVGRLAWTLPYTAPAGDIYKLQLSLRADGYWVQGVNPNSTIPTPVSNTENGLTGRIFPQLSFEWRYPFVRRSGSVSQVFEPIFSFDAAPNCCNPTLIPNEDSLDFQFDETNLFDPNRFTGFDQVDNGQRVNYGFKWSVYGDHGGHTSVLLGQSYQINNNNAFLQGANIDHQLTNVVGAVDVAPNDLFDAVYRFQVDAHNGAMRRQEVGLFGGPPAFRIGINYAFLNGNINDGSTLGTQQEFYGVLNSRINDNWSIFASGRKDLQTGLTLEYGGGITYQNDCISLKLIGLRTNYTATDVTPDTSVAIIIGFKNLGNYGFSF